MVARRPGEAAAKNALDDQVISGRGRANTDAEVELPLRTKININCWNELLLLLAEGIETGDRSVGSVVFETAGDLLREIVTHLRVGRKHHALVDALAVKGAVERRIEI